MVSEIIAYEIMLISRSWKNSQGMICISSLELGLGRVTYVVLSLYTDGSGPGRVSCALLGAGCGWFTLVKISAHEHSRWTSYHHRRSSRKFGGYLRGLHPPQST